MRLANYIAVSFVCLAAVRCGSSVDINQSAGTVDGKSFTVPYAAAMYSADPLDANTPGQLIFLSSAGNICALLQGAHMPKDNMVAQMVLLSVLNGNSVPPLSAGNYAITTSLFHPDAADGNFAAFGVAELSDNTDCYSSPGIFSVATSGTIAVTNIGSRLAATTGSYNLVLEANNTIQGTFTAAPCIVSEAVYASNDAPTCE